LTAYISGNASAVNPNALASNALSGNYPDPVGTQTDINYTLAQSGPVSLVVYNTLGEQVATVVNGMQGAGEHSATFNTGTLPNGAYCYKLQSGDFTATRTMIINR
ncbi:MAG TPA: T9SS type A sorting domain-containing protein, partial [Candidatus Kapabacteria bacterium]|nr:T9SS type A sorting domain-containing protein [Candidatus Kapabacteria bacterium]